LISLLHIRFWHFGIVSIAMKTRRDYTMGVRLIASVAACFFFATVAIPQSWMQRLLPGLLAPAEVYAFQIPVQIPTQKPPTKQQEQNPPGTVGVTRVRVNMVRLYVTVRDKHNGIVPNLQKQDFKVFEDGKQQTIALFSNQMTDPLTLGMLIDTSGSQQGLLNAEKETAAEFLRKVMRKDDLAMVMSFDTELNLLADWTDNQQTLDDAIDKAEINVPIALGPAPNLNQTGTALYDAIYQECRDKLASQTGRKAIIILTDAEDEGSQHTLDEAIMAAQQANTVVHILLIANRAAYFMSGQMYSGGMVANRIAKDTGGRVISIRGEKDLDKAFQEISDELRSQYIVGYYPTNTSANGSFRAVKVETTQEGLRVLTRKGYYAPSSESQ
jgi:VWFA-related protein